MTEKQHREGEAQVYIWAPDANTHPEERARMQKFVEHKEWLTALLKANGVTRADIISPVARGTYKPERDDPMLQYEIIPQSDVSWEHNHAIREAIDDKMELRGHFLLPFRVNERDGFLKKSGLKMIGVPDTSQSRGG